MMAAPVKLWIILGANNAEKMTIESDIPKSVEALSTRIKRQFDIEGDIRLQCINSEFVNLKQNCDIQDKSTVKIICLPDTPQSRQYKQEWGRNLSLSSSDTILLSSPDPETAQSQWPTEFQIRLENEYDTSVSLIQSGVLAII